MRKTLNRRTLFALSAVSAIGTGSIGKSVVFAQDGTSPFTFAGGQQLTWSSPWEWIADNRSVEIVPDSAALRGGELFGEVILGYYESPQNVTDVATAFITLAVGDTSGTQIVAGGGQQTVGADGAAVSTSSHELYKIRANGEEWGFYCELIDGVRVGVLATPLAAFASEMANAQALIQIDGAEIFGGIDGEEYQQFMANAPEAVVQGGEFTDDTGFVNVAWTNDWTELSRDEFGVRLANANTEIILYIAGYPTDGLSWEEISQHDIDFLYGDQGDSPELVGPVITDSGFSFVSNGQYGYRFAQGSVTESADTYALTFAADFAIDSDLESIKALVNESQATVTLNGNPILVDVDSMV